jgi:hypothetical protein
MLELANYGRELCVCHDCCGVESAIAWWVGCVKRDAREFCHGAVARERISLFAELSFCSTLSFKENNQRWGRVTIGPAL